MRHVSLIYFAGTMLLNANAVVAASNDQSAGETSASENVIVSEQSLQQMNDVEAKPQKKEEVEPAPSVKPAQKVEAQGFDVQMRRLSDAMALGLKRLPGDHRDQIFAVFAFDDVGDEGETKSSGSETKSYGSF